MKIRQRKWRPRGGGRQRSAWGFVTVGSDGRQVRQFRESWTRDEAEQAYQDFVEESGRAKPYGAHATMMFGEAIERYRQTKALKRSVAEDLRLLGQLATEFGESAPLQEITASGIAEYKAKRLGHCRSARSDRSRPRQSTVRWRPYVTCSS